MKVRYLILAFVLFAVLALAACVPVVPAPVATTAPAQPTAAAHTRAPEQPTDKQFRVAVVLPSAANDLAFSQSMVDALKRLRTEMGKDNFDFAYSENMFVVGDAGAAIRDYATKGFDLVIAHGSQYGAPLQDIAPDFPNTAFAWGNAVDTFQSKGIQNVFAYTVASDEGGYVEGVMAAKLSKSKVLGALGPIPAGDGQLTIKGFEAGAKATDPNIKVQTTFTNSFSDVALMSQAAQTQIASGADVLTGTSQSVVGAISVAKDKNVLWFGNQSAQTSLAPNIVVASQVYDWTIALKGMMDKIKSGTRGGEVYTMTFKNGGLVMEYNTSYKLPDDVKGLAEKTIEGLKDGSIQTGVK
jgi:basic membrane lipoprotein Med (substrate-binding protein (PBP1-ABC) superfamily)